jgi:hypothetical protein
MNALGKWADPGMEPGMGRCHASPSCPTTLAAQRLDTEECLALTERLAGTHLRQARLIRGLVREYRFDRVLALCE